MERHRARAGRSFLARLVGLGQCYDVVAALLNSYIYFALGLWPRVQLGVKSMAVMSQDPPLPLTCRRSKRVHLAQGYGNTGNPSTMDKVSLGENATPICVMSSLAMMLTVPMLSLGPCCPTVVIGTGMTPRHICASYNCLKYT